LYINAEINRGINIEIVFEEWNKGSRGSRGDKGNRGKSGTFNF
jgi:hypothetical protein